MSKYTVYSHNFYNLIKLIYRAGVHPDRPPRVEPKIDSHAPPGYYKNHTTIMSRKGTWDHRRTSDITMLIEHADQTH